METRLPLTFRAMPARRSVISVLAVAFVLIVSTAALGAGITPGPTLRLAGVHTFTAVPSSTGGAITWSVDREDASESGGPVTRTNGIASATGASVSFALPKLTGRETVYVIHARDNGFEDTLRVQVFPADRRSSLHFSSAGNPRVRVYLIVPSTLTAATRVLMVMHGSSRNADEYCDSWVAWAPRNDYLVLCPRFDEAGWPDSRGYNLGNVFTGDDGAGRLNPESRWAFTVVDDLHDMARRRFGIADESWDLWGHSAGGQFTHRFLLFKPQAKVRFALPANAGWYTAPDLDIDFPYGVRHPDLSFTLPDLIDYTGKRMVIMRGTRDTLRDDDLRTTPEADAQGRNRFQRAGYMFRKGEEVNPGSAWQLVDVPGASHDQGEMAPAAQAFLEAPDPPAAPTNLRATVVSSSQINLTWTDNADDEAGFAIERSTNGTAFPRVATVGANVTSFASTGLAAGATYHHRVRAINGAGDSGPSNVATATTPGAAPAAPTALTAASVSATEIALRWTDNASNETGFKIERSTNGTTFTQVATVGSDVTTHRDRGLTSGVLYTYRVRATNAFGDSAFSPPASARAGAVTRSLRVNRVVDTKNNKAYFAGSAAGRAPMDDLRTRAEEATVEVEADPAAAWEIHYQNVTAGAPTQAIVTLQYRPQPDWRGTITAEYWDGSGRLATVTLPANGGAGVRPLATFRWDVSSLVRTQADLNAGRVRIFNRSTNGKKIWVSYSLTEATF